MITNTVRLWVLPTCIVSLLSVPMGKLTEWRGKHELCLFLLCSCSQQGGVSDDVSLTAYITAALLELNGNVTVSLAGLHVHTGLILKSLKVANSLHLPLVRSCHVRILSQEEMFMLNKWLTFLERRSHLCGAGNKEMSNLLLTVSSACCLYCLRGCVSLAHALKAAQVSVSVILSFVGVLPCLHILLLSLTVTVFLCCDRTPWCRTAWTVWRKQWPASWTTCTPAPCCPTPSLWLETRRRGANSSHTCTTSPTRMVRQWYHQLR